MREENSIASQGISRYANTSVYPIKGGIAVRLHSTQIVEIYENWVALDTGGWNTPTTRKRMNEVAEEYGLGYRVFQKSSDLFVTHGGKTEQFTMNERTTIPRR